MILSIRSALFVLWMVPLVLLTTPPAPADAADGYFAGPVEKLTITSGALPVRPINARVRPHDRWTAMQRYAVLDAPGEAYVCPARGSWTDREMTVAIRTSNPGVITARLYLPTSDALALSVVRFK